MGLLFFLAMSLLTSLLILTKLQFRPSPRFFESTSELFLGGLFQSALVSSVIRVASFEFLICSPLSVICVILDAVVQCDICLLDPEGGVSE